MNKKRLRDEVQEHIVEAMHDMPSEHMIEWHTDIFMTLIEAEVQKERKRIAKQINYIVDRLEKVEV